MKKLLILLVLALLLSSMLVMAVDDDDDEEEPNECGIFNLGSCITQKLFEYVAVVISSPILPLLYLMKDLFSEPVVISIFESLWKIMAYVLSAFYSLADRDYQTVRRYGQKPASCVSWASPR